MTFNSQTLQTQYAPLTSKRNQQAFLTYLQKNFPHVRQADRCIYIGNPNEANLIVQADFRKDVSTVLALTEWTSMLAAPLQTKLCVIFGCETKVFPNKLCIRIKNISKGSMVVIKASAFARQQHSAVIKKSFLPGRTTALQFKKAESILNRFPGDHQEIYISSRKQLFHSTAGNNIKVVCDGLLRLLKAI